jgi:uncharacterized protein (TIGR02145 family)
MKNIVRIVMLSAIVSACLMGCGGGRGELVGQWVEMPNETAIELFKDGTGVADGKNITWKIEGERFVFSGSRATFVSNYNLTGYKLKHTWDDGDHGLWIKKDHLEEYKKEKAEEAKKEKERIRNEMEQKQKQIRKEAEERIEKISSYFTDSRNGQKYRTVKIGDKTWMAQNLNYQTDNSWCYGGDNSNCEKYGRLYDWTTAQTACPAGWHLPRDEEWDGLFATARAGGDNSLMTTNDWNGYDYYGTDTYGFSALPGGRRDVDGDYEGDYCGYWWTPTSYSTSSGSAGGYKCIGPSACAFWTCSDGKCVGKGTGLSVRCIANN